MHVNRSEFTERRNNTVPVKMEIKFLKREVTETLGLCKTDPVLPRKNCLKKTQLTSILVIS